ncbi:helix-turn-helix domain-containing protein [Halorarum halophilum]|uniref:Helix-turn-helix domain-containing protein n=1 Tax=Halorarum halophilum TaxID=2743090 RepID=A0A7D5KWR6_9EURY|nr:helix-turn-helix domain-containing protein [Halobaculum halophilum]QLG27118.1 helix-turn-helix domain-containing protein [Halobaculum halophilum]
MSEASSIVTLALPPEEFVLHRTLREIPDARFVFEQLAHRCSERELPFVWVRGARSAPLKATLSTDPDVERATLLSESASESLYWIDWNTTVPVVLRSLLRTSGSLLNLTGTREGWSFRILYPSRSHVSAAVDALHADAITFDVTSIRAVDGKAGAKYGLTAKQWEAMQLADRLGYFSVPRETNLTDVAAELGISHQAFSARLRRGFASLVGRALALEPSSFRVPKSRNRDLSDASR